MEETTIHTFVEDENITVQDLPNKQMIHPIEDGKLVQLTRPDIDGVRMTVLNEHSLLDLLRVQPISVQHLEIFFPNQKLRAIEDCKIPLIWTTDHPRLADSSIKACRRISAFPSFYFARSVHDEIRTFFYIADGECLPRTVKENGDVIFTPQTKNGMKALQNLNIKKEDVFEAIQMLILIPAMILRQVQRSVYADQLGAYEFLEEFAGFGALDVHDDQFMTQVDFLLDHAPLDQQSVNNQSVKMEIAALRRLVRGGYRLIQSMNFDPDQQDQDAWMEYGLEESSIVLGDDLTEQLVNVYRGKSPKYVAYSNSFGQKLHIDPFGFEGMEPLLEPFEMNSEPVGLGDVAGSVYGIWRNEIQTDDEEELLETAQPIPNPIMLNHDDPRTIKWLEPMIRSPDQRRLVDLLARLTEPNRFLNQILNVPVYMELARKDQITGTMDIGVGLTVANDPDLIPVGFSNDPHAGTVDRITGVNRVIQLILGINDRPVHGGFGLFTKICDSNMTITFDPRNVQETHGHIGFTIYSKMYQYLRFSQEAGQYIHGLTQDQLNQRHRIMRAMRSVSRLDQLVQTNVLHEDTEESLIRLRDMADGVELDDYCSRILQEPDFNYLRLEGTCMIGRISLEDHLIFVRRLVKYLGFYFLRLVSKSDLIRVPGKFFRMFYNQFRSLFDQIINMFQNDFLLRNHQIIRYRYYPSIVFAVEFFMKFSESGSFTGSYLNSTVYSFDPDLVRRTGLLIPDQSEAFVYDPLNLPAIPLPAYLGHLTQLLPTLDRNADIREYLFQMKIPRDFASLLGQGSINLEPRSAIVKTATVKRIVSIGLLYMDYLTQYAKFNTSNEDDPENPYLVHGEDHGYLASYTDKNFAKRVLRHHGFHDQELVDEILEILIDPGRQEERFNFYIQFTVYGLFILVTRLIFGTTLILFEANFDSDVYWDHLLNAEDLTEWFRIVVRPMRIDPNADPVLVASTHTIRSVNQWLRYFLRSDCVFRFRNPAIQYLEGATLMFEHIPDFQDQVFQRLADLLVELEFPLPVLYGALNKRNLPTKPLFNHRVWFKWTL